MNEFPHSISSNNLLIVPNRSWAQFFAKVVFVGGVSVCVVLIILYSIDLYRHGKEKDYIGWFSSAGFVLLTIPISLRLIVQHLTHWNSPNIQKYVVRIIWMIPIYSIESWLALRFKYMAIYLETLRECYEAYVILCFMYYLIALLGGDEHQIILRLKNRPADFGKHNWPISLFLNSWSSGTELLQKCKFGVFQYVFIKNMSALVVFTMHSFGVYKDGQFRFDNAFLYQCIISNLSQLWALYCLLLFYWATKEELASWRPVGKFLCVKSVVFFTWWQSICIELFLASPVGKGFASSDKWTVNEFSKGLQVIYILFL